MNQTLERPAPTKPPKGTIACTKCRGTGRKTREVPCSACNGTGRTSKHRGNSE